MAETRITKTHTHYGTAALRAAMSTTDLPLGSSFEESDTKLIYKWDLTNWQLSPAISATMDDLTILGSLITTPSTAQVINAAGDKFYLHQRHKVTAGSFEVNVTNGGGGIETGIADASWTALEKIISATGNLTFQWLGEAAADDFNISKASIRKCVAGDSLTADKYYTLVYNVDTTTVGAAWTGLGADATEVKSGDLYVELDTADASTATKGSGYIPLRNPLYVA